MDTNKITRRQFIKATGSAALLGSNVSNAAIYKGKTRKFTTGDDCNITFFAVADQHYGRFTADDELRNATRIEKMNSIPGRLTYPQGLGLPETTVLEPRGVIAAGDVTDDGRPTDWPWFENDCCGTETTAARLKWPMYEGLGNHEIQSAGATSNYARDRIRERTLAGKRPAGANISANGYHYSWDWEMVHFVNLNLYPSTSDSAENSFGFMVDDLAANVGSSGRPVVLIQHYDLIRTEWWEEGEQDAYYDAIKDYNIIAIVHGHRHVNALESTTWRGINTFNVGLVLTDTFAVFRITKDKIIAGECLTETSWRSIYTKSI